MCFIIHENWTPENFNDFTVWIIEICVHHAFFFLYTKQPSITSIDWSDKMQGKTWSCDPALYWPILLTSPTPNFSDLFCWPSRPKSHWSILLTSPTPNLTDLFYWPLPPSCPISRLAWPDTGTPASGSYSTAAASPCHNGFSTNIQKEKIHLCIPKIYYPGLNFWGNINEIHVYRRVHNFGFKVRKCKTFARVVLCTCI